MEVKSNTTLIKAARDVGRFSSAQKAKIHFRTQLRNMNCSRLKTAALGGEPESGFEQSFASLAYAYIKDKAPRLLDYMVGFQLVDRNEDNTKAMGVFGFKVGNQWLYAPVFFLNGDLKGHEMLYVKKTDNFVPLKENWVNYIMGKKPNIIGEPSPEEPRDLGQLLPNINQLSIPPRNNKFSYVMPELPGWMRNVMPNLARLMVTDGAKLASLTKQGMPLLSNWKGLDHFLRNDFGLLKAAWQLYRRYPGIKQGIDRFYGGPRLFADIATEYRKQAAKQIGQTSILPPKPPKAPEKPKPPKAPEPPKAPKVKTSSIIEQQNKQAVADQKVRILFNPDELITENLPELTEEEREKLLRDPVLIRDHREGEEVSKAYNVQIKSELTNPDRTMRYQVLVNPGTFEKMLVIHHPHSGRGYEPWSTVIRHEGEKTWLNVHPTEIWCKPGLEEDNSEEYREWVEGLEDVSSLSNGNTYVALGRSGQGTVPFTVNDDLGNGRYKVNFHDDAVKDRPYGLPSHDDRVSRGYDPFLDDYRPWDATVCINSRKGSRFKSYNGMLYLPESAKLFKIKTAPKDDDGKVICCSPESEPAPIEICNIVDVQNQIVQKTARVKLYEEQHELIVDSPDYGSQRLSKTAALVHLVREHGFTEETARNMLKEATVKGLINNGATFRVVYGPDYPLQKQAINPGGIGGNLLQSIIGAPQLEEPELGYDSEFGGVPTQYQLSEFTPVHGMEAGDNDPDIYNPHTVPDPMAVQNAQQAASQGHKQVFDTAMLGQMLKAVREDSIVDRYLPDLIKALDRLGRILFMFYWHQEEFQERYGKADLPELEDSIRNAFETLGDVSLYLRKKTIDTDFQGMGIEEPEIDEAAM